MKVLFAPCGKALILAAALEPLGAVDPPLSSFALIPTVASVSADKIPFLHLKRRVGGTWEYSSNLTSVYRDILHEIATSGTTFKDKNELLTGVGKGSIGVEILKGLLSGGAHVVVTTSRYSRATVEYYQSIFQSFGSRGSALIIVPFNQGSKQDVEAFVTSP
jgi:fatty acid synthase subunit alpha, fungi type